LHCRKSIDVPDLVGGEQIINQLGSKINRSATGLIDATTNLEKLQDARTAGKAVLSHDLESRLDRAREGGLFLCADLHGGVPESKMLTTWDNELSIFWATLHEASHSSCFH